MMLSLRAFTRAIPRSVCRATPSSALHSSLPTISRSTFLRPSWRQAQRTSPYAFSTFSFRREAAGEFDQELAAKLGQESNLEKESRDMKQLPGPVMDFLESSSFDLKDIEGTEQITLTKTFGDETVQVHFSIAEMNYDHDPEDMDPDNAMEDEDLFNEGLQAKSGSQSKGIAGQGQNSGGSTNAASEDNTASVDGEDVAGDESQQGPASPTSVQVTISKPGKGAMQIMTNANDGMITIENIYYYPDADVAVAETPEADLARAKAYGGPPFHNLDIELQTMIERYLDERGINEQLAIFVPEYIDYKEQREYVEWLDSMKSFVSS